MCRRFRKLNHASAWSPAGTTRATISLYLWHDCRRPTFPISSSGGRLILFRQSRPLVALLLPQTRRNARSDYRGHDGEKRSPPRIAEMWCTSPWIVCPDLWRLSIEFIRHVTACNFAFSLLFSIFSQIFWSWSSQIRSRRARVSLPDRALGLR